MNDCRLRRALLPASVFVIALLATGPASAAVTTTDTPRPKVFVVGDAGPDEIRIECVQDQLKVNGSDPPQGPASCAELIELHVTGGGGNDTIDLSALDLGLLALHESDPRPQITADGGEGDDSLLVGGGVEKTTGGPGADRIFGGGSVDLLSGGDGRDLLNGRGGGDLLSGGDGRDLVNGRGGGDVVFAEDGRDRIRGGEGSDKLLGGKGRDNLAGGGGSDSLAGQAGPDLLRGGEGKDKLFGNNGNDRLIGGPGDDKEIQEGSALVVLIEAIFGAAFA